MRRNQVEHDIWRGRVWRKDAAGQSFEFGKSGPVEWTTANSLAADRRGPLQDDRVVKTKLPAEIRRAEAFLPEME